MTDNLRVCILLIQSNSLCSKHPVRTADGCVVLQAALPQHFFNFLPDPQGHGSLRPILLEA